MPDITARIIADSIGADAPRLTTIHMRYPRIIHSELMTHRAFSRNARSSRAVPIEKMIAEISVDPFVPMHWGAAQPGMQARRELEGPALHAAQSHWLAAARDAVKHANAMRACGLHKQVANRILEPFMMIDTLVTATEWENFFDLRLHEDAEPHFFVLARAVAFAMDAGVPVRRSVGEWHLPYVSDEERMSLPTEVVRRLSAARCARISWEPFDGNPKLEAEMERYNKLITSRPMHASPVEHQATPDRHTRFEGEWLWPEYHRNLVGWIQNRAVIETGFKEATVHARMRTTADR